MRSNALIVLAGDCGSGRSVACAGPSSAACRRAATTPLPPSLRLRARQRWSIEARPLPTQYVLGEFVAPALRDPDYHAALLALSVLRDRFFEEVRTKRNLSYAPSASLGQDAANLGSHLRHQHAIRMRRSPSCAPRCARLMDTPLPSADLHDKVRVFVTRYHLQNETMQAQAGFLASDELFAGSWERSRDFVARLEALTPADVQRVAQRMLRHIQYVVLGDPARVDPAAYVDP